MQSPHVDDEKGKKAMVYKARKDRRKGGQKKKKEKRTREEKKRRITSLGHVRSDLLLGSMFVYGIFLH